MKPEQLKATALELLISNYTVGSRFLFDVSKISGIPYMNLWRLYNKKSNIELENALKIISAIKKINRKKKV